MSDPTRPVNVGLIGWGNFSSHIHEQTIRDLIAAGRIELGAVCVRNPDRRQAILDRLPAATGTPDYRQVLDDPAIDAVVIGAPQEVQARYAIEAIEAGKWVYVEKPFFCEEADTGVDPAAFVSQLRALGAPARERLAIGLNKRFAPAYRELRELCQHWGGARHLQMTIIDDAWRWGAKYPPGFLMWLDACHWLDLARWFTGAEIARVSCLHPQVEDSQVTLVMTDASLCTVFLSGNGTMDMLKEELRVVSAGRRCATVADYIEMEVFGGERVDRRRYGANQQNGGDPAYTARIEAGGLDAFKAIRREQFDHFQASRAADPAGDEQVKRNIPNFMRPQGWRESLWSFIDSVATDTPLQNNASFEDAWIAYQLLDVTRRSEAADGAFVDADLSP